MQEQAIGFIETCSIAAGIAAADACLKRAAVELLEARPICPGKFMLLFRGDMSQVQNALGAGAETAADTLVDQLFLPRVHSSIFTALSLTSQPVHGEALGIVETVTAAVCIVASDAAAKAAGVNLVEIRLADGLGGKSFVLMEGTVADVEAGVAAAVAVVSTQGLLVRKVVISHLHPAVREKIL
jgi:microcompartment protein CcmL/EutN